jgi:hypothetical protein
MPVRQLCPKVNLKIRGVDFVANLIVLESKGIDVILGMDWLSKYKVLIDCVKKSVKLTTPEGKEMEFVRADGHCQRCCQSCEGEPTGF